MRIKIIYYKGKKKNVNPNLASIEIVKINFDKVNKDRNKNYLLKNLEKRFKKRNY